MGLWLEDIKGIRVISHGGSMFGYKSNFFLVPEAGVGGVILTNADSGWRVARAIMRRTLEVIYDGKPEAEENLGSGVRETRLLKGEQRDWKVPPDAAEVKRLAGSYRNAALGESSSARAGRGRVPVRRLEESHGEQGEPGRHDVVRLGRPGVRGFEFHAPAASAAYPR